MKRFKKHNYTSYIIVTLLLLVVGISVGYAALSNTLNIKGASTISKQTWDVHFDNIVVTTGSVAATQEATITSTNTTELTYTVNLSLPGDYYEFTVDVVNGGTIDAKLSVEPTLSGLSTDQEVYTNYTATWSDGSTIVANESLAAGKTKTVLVRVEYEKDITASQLPTDDQTLILTFDMTYVQDDSNSTTTKNLYQMMAQSSSLDNTSSEFVTSSTGIDFSSAPSDTNGKGIYELSSTKDDEYPVYYYRGAVTNNNVKFANFCWKIVRTTSTGGVKLIYNGVPDSNGSCNNTGEASQIGTSAFNSNISSPTDVGYMYGTRYEYSSRTMSSSTGFVYGNDVTYENGVYTLKDTMTSTGWSDDYKTIATKYHYTCFSTESTCSSVYYIHYFGDSSYAYYLTLTNGKNIEDAKTEMFTNTNNSTIKTTIDTWYQNNMTSYTSYLEDTVWCNDRSIYSGPLKGKDEDSSSNTYTSFGAYGRNASSYNPSVICPNVNDSFTVNSSNGNGALTYPVALLTADEATLAGHGWSGYNSSSYLYTGNFWWALSPNYFYYYSAHGFFVYSYLRNDYVYSSRGGRASVSLKPGTTVSDGDGSVESPYVIE